MARIISEELGRENHARTEQRGTARFGPSIKDSRPTPAAGTSLQPLAFCPDHRGEKSPKPLLSAAARNGAIAVEASGSSGAAALSGPSSRMIRFTMLRAGRPENSW